MSSVSPRPRSLLTEYGRATTIGEKTARGTIFFIVAALVLGSLTPSLALEPKRRHETGAGQGSWDGRWVGAWGGSQPTAQIVKGGKLVAYEFGGKTFPVATSHVTPTEIIYGQDVVVTLTRTGPNTAHATIKTSQGGGTAELTRQ